VSVFDDPRRRRWLIWGVLAAGFLLVNIYRLSTAVLSEPLARAFETTGTQLGTLHASIFYVYAPLQLVAGVLADRAGIRWTATIGITVMNLGALAFGLVDSYVLAFAARLSMGLGASVIFIAILRFCANWFRPEEFATMNGLTVALAGLGGVLASTPLALLVGALGWRETFVVFAAIGFVVAGVVSLIARDTPATAGLPAIDGVAQKAETQSSLRAVAGSVRTIGTERETWFAGIAQFCSIGVNLTVFGLWGVPYLVQVHDLSVTAASTFALLGSAGLVIGPPTIGWLSDRLGRRTPLMIVGGICYVGAYTPLAILSDPPLAVVAGGFLLAGSLSGAFSLGYPVIKDRHASTESGVATGSVNAIAYVGPALIPIVMGAVLDAYWTGATVSGSRAYTPAGYQVAFAFAALAGVVGLCCVVLLHRRTGGGRTAVGASAGAEATD
jgi:sugar phosphate permease